MKFQRKLSNGQWIDEDRIDAFVKYAVENEQRIASFQDGYKPRTADKIAADLANGKAVKCGADWYAEIRDADAQPKRKQQQPDYPDGRELGCGCIVNWKHEVMSASMGTACSYCYDSMS